MPDLNYNIPQESLFAQIGEEFNAAPLIARMVLPVRLQPAMSCTAVERRTVKGISGAAGSACC